MSPTQAANGVGQIPPLSSAQWIDPTSRGLSSVFQSLVQPQGPREEG